MPPVAVERHVSVMGLKLGAYREREHMDSHNIIFGMPGI
jgi:hypothetical protein